MNRKGFPYVVKQTHKVFYPTGLSSQWSYQIVYVRKNKKVFEDESLKEGPRVRHAKTSAHISG